MKAHWLTEFRSATLRDSRGREVPLWTPTTSVMDDLLGRLPSPARAPIRERYGFFTMAIGILLMLTGGVIAFVGGQKISLLMLCIGQMALLVLLWRASRSRRAARIGEDFVRSGRCASCGYALAGLSRSADGTTTCPECNAAWTLP